MLRKLLLGLGMCYVAVGVGFRAVETQILFHPSDRAIETCPLPAGTEAVRFGEELALYHPIGADRVVVFYHGNGGDVCQWRFLGVNHIARHGWDTLVVEYPGYSNDPRRTTKEALLKTVEAAEAWTAERYSDVAVMGYSMGSGTASHHVRIGNVSRLLLFAPFDQMYRLLRGKGYVYPKFMLRTDFDNIAALTDHAPPSIIVHGGRDQLIPPEHGKALAGAIGAEFILRPEKAHSGLFDSPQFDQLVARWLVLDAAEETE